jgi:phage tail-like protein
MYSIPVGFHFRVDFGESDDDSRFQEVGGLSAEIGIEEYAEGGLNTFSHKLPTGSKYGNLTLKRGIFLDSKVTEWCRKAIEQFVFEPKDITVHLLDEEHKPLASWIFTRVWPVKWNISELKAMENSLVIESLELAHSGFRKI